MGIKKFKPVTPGTRGRSIVTNHDITTSVPEKSLLTSLKKSGGRNNQGKMTMRYLGGGHKRQYRIIDFKRDKSGIPCTVKTIEYDPNRTSRIALVQYKDGEKRYILAPKGLTVGMEIVSGDAVAPELGNCMFMKNIPLGTHIHAIELQPGRGAQLARSAGTYAQLLAKEGKYVIIALPSGETRKVLGVCTATIGVVSNEDHMNTSLGKAGAKRHLGSRPRNRGVSMNPVDHPMGGGEGRTSGGIPRSRKGLPSKGYKTRRPKKHSNKYIIKDRRK